MLSIGGPNDTLSNILDLNIMPVAISYELDPNDYLKAREFLLKKKDPSFKKTQRDDLFSMETGLLQNKGHVHFEFTECINPEIERLAGLDRHEQLLGVCDAIDRHIHANYNLYPCNYIAYDQRMGTDEMRSRYTDDDLRSFNEYLDGQLAKVQKEVDFTLADDDYKYMRDMMLVMYSNPVVNKRKLVEV